MSLLDIIGPIIIGPSSSHTAGAAKIGHFSQRIYNNSFDKVVIDLYNSFSETGRGHGTDRAILGGILGYKIDDEHIMNSFDIAKRRKIKFKFNWLEDEDLEPNTAKITFIKGKKSFSVMGVSVGGGEVEIRDINGYPVKFGGKYPVLIMTYDDVPGMMAYIGKFIADLNINIAFIRIGRDPVLEEALAILYLDSEFPVSEINTLKKNKHVKKVIRIEKLEE